MNWVEFKEHIDKELREQGIPQETELDYIELGYISKNGIEIQDSKDGDSFVITEG